MKAAQWTAGLLASLLVALLVLFINRSGASIEARVAKLEDDIQNNRMTRMAPETRAELNDVQRQLDELRSRVSRIESRP